VECRQETDCNAVVVIKKAISATGLEHLRRSMDKDCDNGKDGAERRRVFEESDLLLGQPRQCSEKTCC